MVRRKDFREKLIELRDEGYSYARLETRQESNVWIDLDTPNPLNFSSSLERGHSFLGMTNLKTEEGWYFDYDDIRKILRKK